MCGLAGVAGTIDSKAKDAFWNLLIFSQVRGMDSSGVGFVSRNYSNDEPVLTPKNILKDVGVPTDLCQYKRFDDVFSHTSKKLYIGHCRAKTIGTATKNNAHPFLKGHILGAHNGTLSYDSKNKMEGSNRFDTDSEGIVWRLAESGVDEFVSLAKGAWAVTWYDSKEDKLYMTRNEQRELYYMYSEDRKLLFWASELGFLQTAVARNGFKLTDPFILSKDKVYSWKLPEYDKPFEVPSIVEYKKEDKKTYENFTSRASSVFKNVIGSTGSNIVDVACTNYKHLKGSDGKVPDEHLYKVLFVSQSDTESGQGYCEIGKNRTRHYRGFKQQVYDKKYWERLTKEGCAWCNDTAVWGDYAHFISREEYVCAKCLTTPDMKLYLGNKEGRSGVVAH